MVLVSDEFLSFGSNSRGTRILDWKRDRRCYCNVLLVVMSEMNNVTTPNAQNSDPAWLSCPRVVMSQEIQSNYFSHAIYSSIPGTCYLSARGSPNKSGCSRHRHAFSHASADPDRPCGEGEQ